MPLKPSILCDLDGVVWLMHQPITGSVDAISRLREAGHRVLFVTNNSHSSANEQASVLESIGIPADGDVVTASQSAGALLHVGERVLTCGGPGVMQAITDAGAIVVGVAVIVERGAKQKILDAGYKYYAAYSLQDLGL